MLRELIGFAVAAGLAISGAQAQEVAGTWAVDFDGLIQRTPDGRQQVVRRNKARLVIEVKGDSAFGTWTIETADGPPRIVKLRGTRKGNSVKLVSDTVSGRMVDKNGQSTTLAFVNTY